MKYTSATTAFALVANDMKFVLELNGLNRVTRLDCTVSALLAERPKNQIHKLPTGGNHAGLSRHSSA
jgi:hypothetical protein